MQTRQLYDMTLSRLMLGTVQLGMNYGIANKAGQPSYEEAVRLIANAYEQGVNCLDTAAIYGNSEEVIGRALEELGIADKIVVVTKVTHMADDLTAAEADSIVEESVVRSLKRLRLNALPICLFHVEDNFLKYADSLLKLRDRGLVRHVGTSTNLPGPTAEVIKTGSAGAIQLPTSVLDQRFIRKGLLKEAARQHIGLFVRSIYLQGLLLMPECDILSELADVIPVRRRLLALANQAGITLAELAVRYLLGQEEITCLVVGADTVEQIVENAGLFSKGPLDVELSIAVDDAVPDLSEKILFPSRWSKRMPDAKPAESAAK